MKKLLALPVLLLLGLTLNTTKSPAQDSKNESKKELKPFMKLEGNNVSDLSKDKFYADFGNISKVHWRRSLNFDEATFTRKGQKITAFYDYSATLVGTTEAKTFADIPSSAQKEIKTKYKGYIVGPVIFFKDNEANDTDMALYDLQFEDADNYFAELTNGKDRFVLRISPDGLISFFKQL